VIGRGNPDDSRNTVSFLAVRLAFALWQRWAGHPSGWPEGSLSLVFPHPVQMLPPQRGNWSAAIQTATQGKDMADSTIVPNLQALSRELMHEVNPIISDVNPETTLESVIDLIEDLGALASQASGTGLATPRIYMIYHAITAALRYEINNFIKKDPVLTP